MVTCGNSWCNLTVSIHYPRTYWCLYCLRHGWYWGPFIVAPVGIFDPLVLSLIYLFPVPLNFGGDSRSGPSLFVYSLFFGLPPLSGVIGGVLITSCSWIQYFLSSKYLFLSQYICSSGINSIFHSNISWLWCTSRACYQTS